MALMVDVRLCLTEEALGTSSASKEIHRDYVIGKFERAAKEGKAGSVLIANRPVSITPEMAAANGEEEVAAIATPDEVDAKGRTVFPRMEVDGDDDVPFLWDYQIKGMFKDSLKALRRSDNRAVSKVKAYKQVIDGNVFVYPRKVPFLMPDGTPAHVSGTCERPLRASTPQGERVALSSSETVSAGTHVDFRISVQANDVWPALRECLTYGSQRGIGQWRNSGKGRYIWKIIEMTGKPSKEDERHMEFNEVLDYKPILTADEETAKYLPKS